MIIQKKFVIHHQTLYIDKVITTGNQSMKLLVTLGRDCQFDENYETQDTAYVLKVWDF